MGINWHDPSCFDRWRAKGTLLCGKLLLEIEMEDRISELESRVAFQEQMIDELNSVVAKQDQILMNLSQVVKILNQKVNSGQLDEAVSDEVEPPPPHY